MASTEVEFLETERRLLDWLQAHASKKDAVVTASDTHILRELQLQDEPHRFFVAKMRLVAAGVLSLFVDQGGAAVIQLNMPERQARVSKRYVQLVVPLELVQEITARTRAWRQEALAQEGKAAVLPSPAIPAPKPIPTEKSPEPPPAPERTPKTYTPEEAQRRGRVRLGVRPVATGPIRPPVRTAAGSA
jgi:hypothetical protein